MVYCDGLNVSGGVVAMVTVICGLLQLLKVFIINQLEPFGSVIFAFGLMVTPLGLGVSVVTFPSTLPL